MEGFDPEFGVPLPDRLARLGELKATSTRLAREAKEARYEMEKYQADLYESMSNMGMESTRIDGTSYARKETIYATVQDRDAFVEWARDHGMEDLTKTVEEKARLSEIVRERIDTGQELPPGVHWYGKQYISVTKAQ